MAGRKCPAAEPQPPKPIEPVEDSPPDIPLPTSPIDIPMTACPFLSLDLPPAELMSPNFGTKVDDELLRLTDPRNITSGLPIKHYGAFIPREAEPHLDYQPAIPSNLLGPMLEDPRVTSPTTTPMPGTNLSMQFDGCNEKKAPKAASDMSAPSISPVVSLGAASSNESSPVFERNVEHDSPAKPSLRTVRSIDTMTEPCKAGSPRFNELPVLLGCDCESSYKRDEVEEVLAAADNTPASTIRSCPSDMQTLSRQQSSVSANHGDPRSWITDMVSRLARHRLDRPKPEQQDEDELPSSIKHLPLSLRIKNNSQSCGELPSITAGPKLCLKQLPDSGVEKSGAPTSQLGARTIANDAESVVTDYDEFKTQHIFGDAEKRDSATAEYDYRSSPHSGPALLPLEDHIYSSDLCPALASILHASAVDGTSWRFKAANLLGYASIHTSTSPTRRGRRLSALSTDDVAIIAEVSTASPVSARSANSGFMGSRLNFDLTRSERNTCYNALHTKTHSCFGTPKAAAINKSQPADTENAPGTQINHLMTDSTAMLAPVGTHDRKDTRPNSPGCFRAAYVQSRQRSPKKKTSLPAADVAVLEAATSPKLGGCGNRFELLAEDVSSSDLELDIMSMLSASMV